MSGARDGGVDLRAGDDTVDAAEIRRGGGGYEDGPVAGGAGREVEGEVRRIVAALEGRIAQLEEEVRNTKKELEKKTKVNEGGKYELVN